jgi:carbamoylphosphate synthase large subunit
MKIAFLRSIEIQQAQPYVNGLAEVFDDRDIEAKLFYTHGDCLATDFPGQAEKLALDASCDEVVHHILSWGADGVISLSIPDENALRDAVVKERLSEHGVPMVMHAVETTRRLANKWETKETVTGYGLDTADGIFVDGDLLNGRGVHVPAYRCYLESKGCELGFPLLVKPLWDCLANGIQYIEDAAAWSAYLQRPLAGNATVEQCLTGELCSVEILGRRGDYVFQPLIWKGPTGGEPSFTFGQLRYAAPRQVADRDFARVRERLSQLCAGLDLDGSVEVEMIYRARRYHIIEINPRVSGTTSLSVAASGCNTYACLVDMLMGRWTTEQAQQLGRRRRLALQFPTRCLDDAALETATELLNVVRASSFHIDGESYANMMITCEDEDCTRLMSVLTSLCAEHDVVSPSVLDSIRALLTRTADELAAGAMQIRAARSLVTAAPHR